MHNQYDLWILNQFTLRFQTLWNTNDKVNHQLKKKKRWKSGCKAIYPKTYVEYNLLDRGFYDYAGTLEK